MWTHQGLCQLDSYHHKKLRLLRAHATEGSHKRSQLACIRLRVWLRGLKRHLLVFCFASQLTRGYRYRYALAPSWCLPVKTVLNIDRKCRAALNQIWTHTWTKISSSGPNVAYAASVPVPINTTGPWFEFAAAVMAVPITFPLSVSAS